MTRALLKRIKNLPPLPETVMRLQDLCRKPETGPEQIAAVVKTDPMFTTNLMKVVNSPLYGFSAEIYSLEHAVTLLGPAMIRGFVVAATLRKLLPLDLSPYGVSRRAFALAADRQRSLMFRWFSQVNPDELSVLSPASFVMDMGQVLVAAELVSRGLKDDFRDRLRQGTDVVTAERSLVEVDNREVCARLFEHWRFEPELVAAIRHMPEPGRAEEPVCSRAGALAAVAVRMGPVQRGDRERDAREAVLAAGWDPEAFEAAARRVLVPDEEVPA